MPQEKQGNAKRLNTNKQNWLIFLKYSVSYKQNIPLNL